MTNEYIQQKFSELLYELGECNFNVLTDEAWQTYVNENKKFSEKQLQLLKRFAEDIVQEELTELSQKYIR